MEQRLQFYVGDDKDEKADAGDVIIREMIAAGCQPPFAPVKHGDSRNVLAALERQKKRVRQQGECERGCENVELLQHCYTQRWMCPFTCATCPRQLADLVEQYSKIGTGK